jgi:hypothetical protein
LVYTTGPAGSPLRAGASLTDIMGLYKALGLSEAETRDRVKRSIVELPGPDGPAEG